MVTKPFLLESICCFKCSYILVEFVEFLWGASNQHYKFGDRLRWVVDDQNAALKHRFRVVDANMMNYGYIEISELIAFDGEMYPVDGEYTCPECDVIIGGIGVLIEDSVIKSASSFSLADVQELFGNERFNDCDVVVKTGLVKYAPRPELNRVMGKSIHVDNAKIWTP